MDDWERQGIPVETIGHSRSGRPIRLATFGEGEKHFLAWGFPHPDEPIGAEGLIQLGEGLLKGLLTINGWQTHLILCADPDNTALNHWLGEKPTLQNFVRKCWIPAEMGLEVDYGFPLDYPPFSNTPNWQGRCRSKRECLINCGGGLCRRQDWSFSPLPESLALVFALKKYRPLVVAAMHNALLGGDYTFLLEREKPKVMEELLTIPSWFNQPRHLGEALDRGRRWKMNAPDLIREPRFIEFLRFCQRLEGWDPNIYGEDMAIHSAGNYIEINLPKSQFTCPEACLFHLPSFQDTSLNQKKEPVLVSVEDRRLGRREVIKIKIKNDWHIAQLSPTQKPLSKPRLKSIPQTRAMLGVRAVWTRRQALIQADQLWVQIRSLPNIAHHPYEDERYGAKATGDQSDGGALRLFISSERFHQQATVAQASSFDWSWSLETAAKIGNLHNFLLAQESTPQIEAISQKACKLQDELLEGLPEEIRGGSLKAPAIRSQLARVLTLIDVK